MKPGINRLCAVLMLICCCVVMTGCWDYFEVEQRGYVLGLAIDDASIIDMDRGDEGEYNRRLESIQTEEGEPEYAYTIQFPIISRAEAKPTGQSGGTGGGKKRVWNLTMAGNSFFEVERQFSTRTDFTPFFEHIQSIIISEKVARKGIIEPLDMLTRDPEMRRSVKVFVTSGEARKILEIEPKIDDYSAMYIERLAQNVNKTSRMLHLTDLGKMSEHLHSKRAFLLPRIITDTEEVKYAGGALFKDGKMLGWLDELDINYTKWVSDAVKGGTIVIPMPDHPEDLITLEISKANTKVEPEVSGDDITLHIKSKAKVYIAEEFREEFYDTFNVEFIRKLEEVAEKKLAEGMRDTIDYVRSEYEADIFFFDTAMERYAPDAWDRVKDNWEEVFQRVKIKIDVDINMGQRGLIM